MFGQWFFIKAAHDLNEKKAESKSNESETKEARKPFNTEEAKKEFEEALERVREAFYRVVPRKPREPGA